jgi:pyridoxal phosphate enzyme (YggS family)
VSELAERLHEVDGRIADSVRDAGRDPGEITRIVVTKFHPAALVRELAQLGVADVGENRHQDAEPKARELEDLGLTWHFVGQLQSKKARAVSGYASVVHSLDRDSVVDALARDATDPVRCFVQINLTDDPGRGGVAEGDLLPLVERVAAAESLDLLGVMAVAPLDADPLRAFARVRGLSERVREVVPSADRISTGMSHDFPEAIREGATHLRIGTAITGNRPTPG